MFQELTAQLQKSFPQLEQTQQPDLPSDQVPEQDIPWSSILDDLPAAPALSDASVEKIFKLAKELKRRTALMTAGRDLHDMHTTLYPVAHWEHLQETARNYTAHRLRLLYVEVTEEWPAALFYDQQDADEFLDVAPDC
jgi:hypothetical protein